jgi:hypothetical protein
MGHTPPLAGIGGALGTAGSAPTGRRFNPSAVCWGSGGGVVVSTGSVRDTGGVVLDAGVLGGGTLATGGGGGAGWGGTAWAGSSQAQPVVVGGTQQVTMLESAKLWGDSGMLGGAYRIGGTQHRVPWA